MSRVSAEQAKAFKEYLIQFIDALKPIILNAMGSDIELSLVRGYVLMNSAAKLIGTYKKQVEIILDGQLNGRPVSRPVWQWIVLKNDTLLMDHPELLMGIESERIKKIAQVWVSKLTIEQKQTVFAWLAGMVNLGGYDITSVE